MTELDVIVHPWPDRISGSDYPALLCKALDGAGVRVRRLDRRKIWSSKSNVLHVHWPEYYFGGRGFTGRARRALGVMSDLLCTRIRRQAIVWTVHNLYPHEGIRGRTDRVFWWAFPRFVDGSVHLSSSARDLAFERYPSLRNRPSQVAPHGFYPLGEETVASKEQARTLLGLPEDRRIIVSVGAVREYKRIDEVIRRFRDQHGSDLMLVVAGKPWTDELREDLVNLAGDDERIQLRLDFVSEADWELLIRAADLVLAMNRDMFNSGSAMAALSRQRAVVVPATATTHDLAASVGSEWVRRVEDIPDLRTLETIVDDVRANQGVPDLSDHEWAAIAAQHVSLYSAAFRRARGRRFAFSPREKSLDASEREPTGA